jgi:L-ascorbate metabolism protein UlaG (beta-lactamase superfamily)
VARYANSDPTHTPHQPGEIFRWMVLDPVRRRRRIEPAGPPAPRVEPDMALIHRPAEAARITWLGHASFLCSLAGHHLVVDPVFSNRIAVFVPRYGRVGLRPDQLPPLSCLAVSHNHYDHLDLPSLRAIPMEVPAVVPRGMGRWFRCWHRGRPVTELEWWEPTEIDGVRLTLVPARHWSRRRVFDTNRQLWGGWVIEKDGVAIYHAGDSAWFEGFEEIGRRFPALDLALLPIGGYKPAWFMEQQHMNPEQAIRAFDALGARRMVPMHWGTFQLTDEPIGEPAEWLERAWAERDAGDDRLSILAVGETLQTPAGAAS